MEQSLLVLLFSLSAVIGGGLALLVFSLVVIPRLTRRSAETVAVAEPLDSGMYVSEPPDSVIIAQDYEHEAQPERAIATIEPLHAICPPPTPPQADDSDSFSSIFGRPQPDEDRLARRLDRLANTRATTPLPMPVAPPGVEPIPELEPTELFTRRPDWASDWP